MRGMVTDSELPNPAGESAMALGCDGASDADADSAIGIRALCKRYDGPLAVDDVSFDVAPGEFVTLLGPSGSGKTSTLMMVAGFEQPTSGMISLHGRSVTTMPARERDLGVVFQHYSLFPHMSVVDNVAFPLRMRKIGRSERRRRAMSMLERVDLAEFASRRPRQLSGGQQQRVALARALVFDPAALLLDEPLGALDKRLRDQLQIEIKAIQKKLGVSVLFVTHDQAEAMMMSDRIAVMNHGRVEQIGTPEALYNRPNTAFIATFLGETNLLPCTVEAMSGESATVILADDGRCTAALGEAVPTGGQYGLSIRPERLRPVGDGAATDGLIHATVKTHTFLGSSHRLVAEGLGQELVVSIADTADTPIYRAGEQLQLGFNAEDARLIALDTEE